MTRNGQVIRPWGIDPSDPVAARLRGRSGDRRPGPSLEGLARDLQGHLDQWTASDWCLLKTYRSRTIDIRETMEEKTLHESNRLVFNQNSLVRNPMRSMWFTLRYER